MCNLFFSRKKQGRRKGIRNMTRTIKIGFLSLYSSIYPQLNHQLVEGFVLPFASEFKGEKYFEFIPEYVQQGSVKEVSEAIKKLIHFHGVDIIAGPISYQVAPQVISMIESRGKLAFFFDMGEYIPSERIFSPHVFYNSYQLWQAEYALGYWAHKEFGDKGMILMPLYEAGYQMHAAFRQGTVQAGSAAIDYTTLPYQEGKSQVSHHVEALFEKLRQTPPSYLHVLFSGTEATEFMARFFDSGLQHTIPLLVSPLMARADWLSPFAHIAGSFYASSVWNPASTDPANEKFVQLYQRNTGKKPEIYTLLGYEMGLAFREMLPELRRHDWTAVTRLLQQEIIYGPRGPVNFWPQSGFALPTIDIEKINMGRSGNSSVIVSRGKGLLFNSPSFSEILQETKTGWQNPYLCV
jgi:branched-chain amino acid transport system substrate-binding protein